MKMKLLAIAIYCVATIAFAATGALEVRGVALGSSLDELMSKFGVELDCYVPDKTNPHHEADFDGGFMDDRCWRSSPNSHRLIEDTYAGHEARMTYGFHDRKLVYLLVYDLRPSAFDSVEATMESKFGKPEIVSNEVHNGFGAKFENRTALWKLQSGIIQYRKYVGALTRPSMLEFFSQGEWDARQAYSATKADAAKSDL